MYEKYANHVKDIQTKLCFPEAESCLQAMTTGGPEDDSKTSPSAEDDEEAESFV